MYSCTFHFPCILHDLNARHCIISCKLELVIDLKSLFFFLARERKFENSREIEKKYWLRNEFTRWILIGYRLLTVLIKRMQGSHVVFCKLRMAPWRLTVTKQGPQLSESVNMSLLIIFPTVFRNELHSENDSLHVCTWVNKK